MKCIAQQDINVLLANPHIKIHTAKIRLNLRVKSAIRKENFKMVLMSVNNVNIMLYIKNVMILDVI